MTLAEAISKINYSLRGTDDEAPAVDSDEWDYWVSTLNDKKNELYQDVTKLWTSAFSVESLGTVSASTAPVFDLPDEFLAPASFVYVITSSGQRVEYELIKPEEKDFEVRNVYIAGFDPEQLFFTDEITDDEQIVDGELFMPGYYLPDDFTSSNETIICPDPNWLVKATAAELAFNDIVYEDRAEGLNAKANSLYKQMVSKNWRGSFGRPRTIPYNINRLHGPERR